MQVMLIYSCQVLLLVFTLGFVGTNIAESKTETFLETNSVFRAQLGLVGYLTCTTGKLTNHSLAWLRRRDNHILTVDKETFIHDKRLVIFEIVD